MTEHTDIERVLERWFEDGPSRMPDRVAVVVADRIDRERQRRPWRLPWRPRSMNLPLKLGAAALTVVLVAIIGVNLLPGTSGVGGPVAPATAAPTASPTLAPIPSPSASPVACEDDLPGCAGPLTAGTHTSTSLDPSLTYVTPDGWTNVIDTPTIFKLDPIGGDAPYLIVWTRPLITDMNDTNAECDTTVRPGAGTSVQDWIDFLSTHPGLVASDPVAVDLGGITGQSIDVAADTGLSFCRANGFPVVQFISNTDPLAGEVVYGVGTTDRMHLVILDVGGQTVIVQAYGGIEDAAFTADIDKVQPLLDSFRFAPGP